MFVSAYEAVKILAFRMSLKILITMSALVTTLKDFIVTAICYLEFNLVYFCVTYIDDDTYFT